MNPSADQVMDLIFGRWRSQILSAGRELGVFDRLDKARAKATQTLAAELDADPTLLYRLLRAQAAIGLLEADGSRGFVLTDKGELQRCQYVAGDMFEAVPKADAYSLKRFVPARQPPCGPATSQNVQMREKS